MEYNHLFNRYTFNLQKAYNYGFEKKNDFYTIQKSIMSDDFVVCIVLGENTFNVKVFEKPDLSEYIPFNVMEYQGEFVSKIRKEVDLLIKDIISNCFDKTDIKLILIEYVKEKYKTIPKNPWNDEAITLNTNKNQKWYGLLMTIPYKSIGVKNENKVDILNIKASFDNIHKLIDNINYFPAYHMNKKHWLTVVLNKNTNIEFVKKLIDESYELVEK